MVTACSTTAGELLSLSPAHFALHLRLRQWEALKNKTNRGGKWTSTCSKKSTTIPSERKMERNLSNLSGPHDKGTWVLLLLRPTYGPGRHCISTQTPESRVLPNVAPGSPPKPREGAPAARACRGSSMAPAAQGPAAWCTNKDLRHVRTWQAVGTYNGRLTHVGTQMAHRWHELGALQLRTWRAPARQLARAKS